MSCIFFINRKMENKLISGLLSSGIGCRCGLMKDFFFPRELIKREDENIPGETVSFKMENTLQNVAYIKVR